MVKYFVFNLITLLERRFRVKQCSFIEKIHFLSKKTRGIQGKFKDILS